MKFVSSRAFALKRPNSVNAISSLTQPGNSLALVHILTSSSADVGNEATAAGVRLGRTHLTGVAPGSAHCGTAECFGADNPAELSLAHLVADHSKTRACSVISFTLGSSKAVCACTPIWGHTPPSVETATFTDRLSTVRADVSLLTQTVVIAAATSIHAADVTVLDGSGATGRRYLTGRASAHIWPRAESIPTGMPANGNNALISTRQGFPSRTTVRVIT